MINPKRLHAAWPLAATSLALLVAAPAMGAPAGSEYLPAEPSATGGEGNAGSEQTGSAAASTGTGGSDAGPGGKAEAKGDGAGGDKQGADRADAIPVTQASASDEDSSGVADTLLDPIVLLLIAGVMVVALGMTLRRRHGDDEGQDGDRALRDPATVPPTPDGEIVAGGERRS